MCTSSAIARIITSGGIMLARMLYVNPISTYRPIVQTKLTTTAPMTSIVSRQDRNSTKSAPIVSRRIGGVSIVRFDCVTLL